MGASRDDCYAGAFAPAAAGSDACISHNGACNSEELDAAAAAAAVVVSPGLETATLLDSLYPLSSPADVGTDAFCAAYCVNLERLSIQAHRSAGMIAVSRSDEIDIHGGGGVGGEAWASLAGAAGGGFAGGNPGKYPFGVEEEYIVRAFREEPERIEGLIRTLLCIELWREHVLFGKNKRVEGGEEEEVELEVEGGDRTADECYDALNDVDGGEDGATIEAQSHAGGGRGLAPRLASNGNALRTAFILHAETTIVSLLGLVFYNGLPAGLLEGSGNAGDDALLSLIDYCARQLVFLGTPAEANPALGRQKHPLPAAELAAHIQARSRGDEIRDALWDATYQTAVASVTVARYLCEHADELGPSLLGRMLETHDFPLLFVPLVEEPPWTRRRTVERRGATNGNDDAGTTTRTIWEKLDDHNEWAAVPPSELLRLTKLEGQPWLALFHLTTSKACREAYGLDEHRKSRLMRLRGFLPEALLDQLPVLGDVARYLDELSIMGVPPAGQGTKNGASNASASGLLLQRVDTLRESIVDKKDVRNGGFWEGIVERQWEEVFSKVTDASDPVLRRIATEVYGGAGLDDELADAAVGASDLQSAGMNEAANEQPRPAPAAEDWKVALSRPVERVTLQLEEDGVISAFELVAVQNGATATTQTPLGPFRRVKLAISQTGVYEGGWVGERVGNHEISIAVFPHAKAKACIRFQSDPSSAAPHEATLSLDSLALPTAEHGSLPSGYDEVGLALPETFPAKEWRQLGDLEGKTAVLQLGFRRLERGTVPAGSRLLRGYALAQAYLSQPVAP
ncbi:hypothetical protein ACHAXT_011802 [Thalassiosira profunda]